MKDNFKIAVMLNGHPKHLETTQHLYKHWNNLYDNVEFDFFVSVWDTIDNDYESFGRVLDINELDWVTKFELLKEEDCPYDLKSHDAGRHQPHYCYTLKKVNDLRNSHDEEYDAVLQTRCDYVIFKKTLDGFVRELTRNRVTDRNIFSKGGVSIHSVHSPEHDKWTHSLWTHDYYFFGSPKVFDIFSTMFDDMWMNKDYDGVVLLHVFQAEHLWSNGIYIMKPKKSGLSLLIREAYRFSEYNEDGIEVGTQVIKKQANTNQGWALENPTPKQLIKLIEVRGLDWLYNPKNEMMILENFRRTPKI